MTALPPEYLDTVVTGDARVLAERIPDESVDAVICDPVYQRPDDYAWLTILGARVLRPGGNLIAQCAHYNLPDVLAAMKAGPLSYVWIIAQFLPGGRSALWQHRILCTWKPHLWFAKGPRKGAWVLDWIQGAAAPDKSVHAWGDSTVMFANLIARLTELGDIVLDPFTGGGTVPVCCIQLGRHFVGFEIEPEVAARARARLAVTQRPLPGLDLVEQLPLEVE